MSNSEDRLREHPATRFASPELLLNLQQSGDTLQQEAHAGQHGHRQITVYHGAGVTMVLFAFEAGGELADHSAKGLVTIHALDGALTVRTATETYELGKDKLVVLQPGIVHNVLAREVSRVLLTVHKNS